MEKSELMQKAIEARSLSYSPYSKFAVGAAIICKDGSLYLGANVENAAYTVGNCAERNAIYNAMMHGKKKEDFLALSIAADCPRPCSPCGACRQVISELCPPDMPIYLTNLKGDVLEISTKELIPFAFSSEDL